MEPQQHINTKSRKNGQLRTDLVLEKIRECGGRVTSIRRLIFEVALSQDRHWTAEDLARAVNQISPDTHLSTIYRNLEELEKMGILIHSHLGHGPATYHLADQAHGHLCCDKCESLIELDIDITAELSSTILKRYGFSIDQHHFALTGKCSSCKPNTPPSAISSTPPTRQVPPDEM